MAKDYVGLSRAYETAVAAGEILACKRVRQACERNIRDRARAEASDPTFPYRFDGDAATRICRAAEKFPHIKGAKAKVIGRDDQGRVRWAPIELEPWQCWLLTTLFGWLHVLTGMRRFKVALILVPRKNAKSTIGAVIANFMLTADGESGAEVYSAATTREQAKAVAETAWEMAKRSPEFREYFGVRMGAKTTRSLEVPATASKFGPLSADAHTLDGLNVSCAIVDELHAHKTRDVWDVLDTATGAREQSLLAAITTAGVDIGGICYEKRTYLHKVLERALEDEEFFGVEYTIDEGDDWRAESSWRKANPNFGVSVRPDDLKRKAREAAHSPAAINNFLTKHLDVWVRAESTWMPMAEWIRCGDATLKIEDFIQYPCWIGVDLAEVRDVAAIVALFRPDPKRYVIFGKFFLPEKTIERSPIAQMPGWVEKGHIIATDGDQADYALIEDEIIAWCDLFADVREIDFDRALASRMAPNLKVRLQPRMGKDGVDQFVVTVPQNVETMNPAMQLIESLTLGGDIAHEANPAFNWMWSNIVVERNYKDEIYPRKAGGKDSPHKIDGPVATLTAISRASQTVIGRPRRRARVTKWTPEGFVPVVPADAEPASDLSRIQE
jgi:phage terminase large subunit-like protein